MWFLYQLFMNMLLISWRLYQFRKNNLIQSFCHITKCYFLEKNSAMRDKKIILTLVLSEKKILNETKNHNPPLQVKWSVPYWRCWWWQHTSAMIVPIFWKYMYMFLWYGILLPNLILDKLLKVFLFKLCFNVIGKISCSCNHPL